MNDASLITLSNDIFEAKVSTNGAWLETFSRGDQQILYPKNTLHTLDGSTKVRGGCHVCLPNFGPGGESGMPQHGLGRTMPWQIASQSGVSTELMLDIDMGTYAGLNSLLEYKLLENGLQMKLTVTNTSLQEMAIAPGFHPYFAHNRSDQLKIDDYSYTIADMNPEKFLDSVPQQLITTKATVTVEQDQLNQWVLWSDSLDDYVCLESTYAGYAFAGQAEPLTLESGSSWQGSLRILVTQNKE